MHLPVAAGVDEDGGARMQRHLGVGMGRLDRAVLLEERPDPREGHHQLVGQLVEAAFDAEVAAEGQGEDDAVGAGVAARVVADEEHGPLVGNVVEPSDLGPVPQGGEEPGQRQGVPDVVGVAVVEQFGEGLVTRH